MRKLWILFILLLNNYALIHPLKLDRVILASDTNPMYIDFWPMVAKAWQQIVGIRPTLILIADENFIVDETLGDVIRFQPIPGIPTSLQAQVIRIFAPALFANDGCIISDIDMLPLNKNYYINHSLPYADNSFIAYRDGAYGGTRFPMCYVTAKGSTFQEIFNIYSMEDIRKTIIQWASMGYGWNTDEILMFEYVTHWPEYHTRCKRLGHGVSNRIDRSNWRYDVGSLRNGHYIDAHMIRPYNSYKQQLDHLAHLIGIQ